MKKCATTYLLLLSCLFFFTLGNAAPDQSSELRTTHGITAKKIVPVIKKSLEDRPQDVFCRYAINGLSYPQSSYCALEEFGLSLPIGTAHLFGNAPYNAADKQQNHLLHLFPSHYFW